MRAPRRLSATLSRGRGVSVRSRGGLTALAARAEARHTRRLAEAGQSPGGGLGLANRHERERQYGVRGLPRSRALLAAQGRTQGELRRISVLRESRAVDRLRRAASRVLKVRRYLLWTAPSTAISTIVAGPAGVRRPRRRPGCGLETDSSGGVDWPSRCDVLVGWRNTWQLGSVRRRCQSGRFGMTSLISISIWLGVGSTGQKMIVSNPSWVRLASVCTHQSAGPASGSPAR